MKKTVHSDDLLCYHCNKITDWRLVSVSVDGYKWVRWYYFCSKRCCGEYFSKEEK